MSDPIEQLAKRDSYGKRTASKTDGDQFIFVSAQLKQGAPYLYVSVGDEDERKRFNSLDELDERFEELVEKHNLEKD